MIEEIKVNVGMTLASFVDCHVYPILSTNFFAVPLERGEEVKQSAYQLLHKTSK